MRQGQGEAGAGQGRRRLIQINMSYIHYVITSGDHAEASLQFQWKKENRISEESTKRNKLRLSTHF